MKIRCYQGEHETGSAGQLHRLTRIETTAEAADGQQFNIILLDADDTFDIIIEYPNNERECVWSLAKEPPRVEPDGELE